MFFDLELIMSQFVGFVNQYPLLSDLVSFFSATEFLLLPLYYIIIHKIGFRLLEWTRFKIIHNYILSFLSLVMFGGFMYEFYQSIIGEGIFWTVCRYTSIRYGMFWMKVFYWSKYYELIDTLFIKKPIFLHTYHHIITPIMVKTVLFYNLPTDITIGILNTFVHIIMYYYYGQTAQMELDKRSATNDLDLAVINATWKKKLWYKKYITSIQLTQFTINVMCYCVSVYYAYYHGYSCEVGPLLHVLMSGNISFLILFTKFYFKTYSTKENRSE
jgi:fatty acid elongase 3